MRIVLRIEEQHVECLQYMDSSRRIIEMTDNSNMLNFLRTSTLLLGMILVHHKHYNGRVPAIEGEKRGNQVL